MHNSTHDRARVWRTGLIVPGLLCVSLAGPALANAASLASSPVLVSVSEPEEQFAISGDLTTVLYPGGSGPLDLNLTNPRSAAIRVTGLTVQITEVRTASPLGCSRLDFALDQLTGDPELKVPGSSTRSLSALGVPQSGLPRVRMPESAVNQDGCQNATLLLAYRGTAVGTDPGEVEPGDLSAGDLSAGDLPGTGTDNTPWVIALVGLGLLGVGAGALRLVRRRSLLTTADPARGMN